MGTPFRAKYMDLGTNNGYIGFKFLTFPSFL